MQLSGLFIVLFLIFQRWNVDYFRFRSSLWRVESQVSRVSKQSKLSEVSLWHKSKCQVSSSGRREKKVEKVQNWNQREGRKKRKRETDEKVKQRAQILWRETEVKSPNWRWIEGRRSKPCRTSETERCWVICQLDRACQLIVWELVTCELNCQLSPQAKAPITMVKSTQQWSH